MRFVIFFMLTLLFLTVGAYGAIENVSLIAATPGQYAGSTQQSVSAQGGNTTYLNLTGNSNTDKWQGFYGDMTGSLRLGDGASLLYDFGAIIFQAVFASSNNSVDFATVTGLGAVPQQVAADGIFGFGATVDNITTVVDDLGTCAAGTEIVAAGGITTLNSTGGSWSAETCFAGTIAAPTTVDEYIWGTNVITGGAESFVSGLNVEYQLMVPVSVAGDQFYFYVEI